MHRSLFWLSSWFFLTLATLFIPAATVYGQPPAPSSATVTSASGGGTQALYQKETSQIQLALSLAAGLRFDQLAWSTAGTIAGTNPNILSELEWSGVMSHQLSGSGYLILDRYFYGRGQLNYAWIQSGTVRDSDYGADNRAWEFSRSISETNGDQLWDVVVGGGYPFMFEQKRLLIAPLLGASLHKQNLRITNGQQVISETPPPGFDSPPEVGPLSSELNSMYSASWSSFWTGCDLRYQMAARPNQSPPMAWGLSLAYHFWADYSAEADWNLRGDLAHPVSFRHDADAQGVSLQGEWLLGVSRRWNLRLEANYTRWASDPGVSTVYPVPPYPTQTTRLNEVTWESHSVMVGATCRLF
jgi:hypothetical protein